MKYFIYSLVLSIIVSCSNDNQIGSRFHEKKVIKNKTDKEIQIKLFSAVEFPSIFFETTILPFDSAVALAYCEVAGQEKGCLEIEGDYNRLLFELREDSMHIIFNGDSIFRYVSRIFSCSEESTTTLPPSCGFTREVSPNGDRTYSFEITDEYFLSSVSL